MIKAVGVSMASQSPAFDDAARVSGLSFFKRFRHLIIPLNSRGIIVGAMVAFVLSINELNIPLLLVPPGKATLSIRLFTLMHFAPDNVLYSLGLCMVMINMFACALAFMMYRGTKRVYLKAT